MLEKSNKRTSWFFEKFAKIDKSLVMLSKNKRERPKLSTSRVKEDSFEAHGHWGRKEMNEPRMNEDIRKKYSKLKPRMKLEADDKNKPLKDT